MVLIAFVLITSVSFYLAGIISENQNWHEMIQSLGLIGIILVSIVTGLNAFVPIPPATFAPIFLEVGVPSYVVIGGFVIGTTIADSIGFYIGTLGRNYAHHNFSRAMAYTHSLIQKHKALIPFLILSFFMLAPLPNETILIPLAIMGYKYKKLILPLIFGNIIHQTIMVYGYSSVFTWFFKLSNE